MKKIVLPLEITAENVTTHIPTRHDITFTHSVFAQCFLPLRKLQNNAKRFEINHGFASLLIKAGDLLNPETKVIEEQDVPYGSAARIVLAHIHNHIIRASSLDEACDVPMGHSLREFFRDYQLKISGKNGKQLTQQISNIAAAHITIGIWTDKQAKQINIPTLAEEINFWLEKDQRQRTLWQPSMVLNRRYAEAIRERAVPLDMRVLIGLYEKPRVMDIFTWLSYRLPQVKEQRGIFLPYEGENGLHRVFGTEIHDPYKFKQSFENALKEIHKWYPEARLQTEGKGIRLFHSPSPIPREYSLSHGKSLFFVDKYMQ